MDASAANPDSSDQGATGTAAGQKTYLRSPTLKDLAAPHPIYCVWELTLQCDLSCRHCGSRAGTARPGELTTNECFEVVRKLADLGIREVTLIGGEAYLRDDWHLIAAEIVRLGIGCAMTTGARALNEERVSQAVDSGLDTISISIDGLEKTHDSLRGVTGSWAAAVDAARRVAASPIRLTTNTQINRLSMPELPALADLLVEIGSKAWQVQLTVAMGRAGDRPNLILQPYELLDLFPLLIWIEQNRLSPNHIALVPGNNIGYHSVYADHLKVQGNKRMSWSGCSAGKWTLGLEADGKIKGCPSLQTVPYTGGNIRVDDLKTVVAKSPQLQLLQERTRDDLWGFCRSCEHADTCKAGCSWTSHSLFGKPGNNPFCIHRALDFEQRGLRERLELIQMPPGMPFDNGRYELIEEPLPPGDGLAAISGVDLESVRTATFASQGLSSPDQVHAALQRSPGRE